VLIAYLVICGISLLLGVFVKPKMKIKGLVFYLILTAITTFFTTLLVSTRENTTIRDSFFDLISFEASAARASFGAYATSAFFCYVLGLLLNWRKV